MEESETIEFKKSLAELKSGLISIASILNKHNAGELWFGVRNDGHVVGMDASEKTLRNISQSIAAHIEPKIYPQVGIESIKGANCVKITFNGKDVPYYAHGRAYMRVADEDRQLSAKELENLILSKKREQLQWDREVSQLTIDDIDEEKLKNFIDRAGLPWDSATNSLE
jgi:ATP-dependent DNA helicase RecG